jgi:hypothetical protein
MIRGLPAFAGTGSPTVKRCLRMATDYRRERKTAFRPHRKAVISLISLPSHYTIPCKPFCGRF